jgi:hypothetical protein
MTIPLSAALGTRKPLVGVVHLLALPGSPGAPESFESVLEAAGADARALFAAGFDAVIVENFGDRPFYPFRVPAETVAAMTAAALEVRRGFPGPLGINVLRNDGEAALAVATAVGATFVRVNVLVGTAFTDQGMIEGRAHEIARLRRRLDPKVAILADVLVKHAVFPAGTDLAAVAGDTWLRGGADALVVTGSATGSPADPRQIDAVRAAVPEAPLLVGSGVTSETVKGILARADGVIVGTDLKVEGKTPAPVDQQRAKRFVSSARG